MSWKLVRVNHEEQIYDLHNGPNFIGRILQCAISLPSTIVSRKHCVINVNNDTVTLTDLRSSNGTYVNNEKIEGDEPVLLKNSYLIGIGWRQNDPDIPEVDKYLFTLVRDDHPSPIIISSCSTNISNDEIKLQSISLKKSNVANDNQNWLKRRLSTTIKSEEIPCKKPYKSESEILINLVSDDSEGENKYDPSTKETISIIKDENQYDEVSAIKQELENELISIDSDDSCDADLWLSRLSQSQIYDDDEKKLEQTVNNGNFKDLDIPNFNEDVFYQDIIVLPANHNSNQCLQLQPPASIKEDGKSKDKIENCKNDHDKDIEICPSNKNISKSDNTTRKLVIIEPKPLTLTSKSNRHGHKKKSTANDKKNKNSIANEQRKKKLYELATKNKLENTICPSSIAHTANNSTKQKAIVKVTSTSRGAFLAETEQNKCTLIKNNKHKNLKTSVDNVELVKSNSKTVVLSEVKKKKSVRFSLAEPKIIEFSIEPGNKLINIKYAKPNVEHINHSKYLSSIVPLDRQYIYKVLKWNTNWLKEKKELKNSNELPDLMGKNVTPLCKFHKFPNHVEYMKQIGHLLLIDVWDTITQDYIEGQENMFEMRISSISPSNKARDSYVTICINMSLNKKNVKNIPRHRDIMMLTLRPGSSKFFYVHEVTSLPAPPNNVNSFFSIQLHTTQSEKLKNLQQGDLVYGKNLINMNSYMILFQAMQCLSTSPLCEVVLDPQPHHFTFKNVDPRTATTSKWRNMLNPSQLKAVETTVAAALSDTPSIQMIQGPPGTGKTSVICSIVMTYFYGDGEQRNRTRGKILICATSNAAVDELVLRLLKIRQTLPHGERFRMVRVGRDEVMHEGARNISLKTLAERAICAPRVGHDAPRRENDHITAELNHLETKENMWRSSLANTTDPARQAYCQSRLEPIILRRQQLKATLESGSAQRSLTACEKEIVQKADIVATTLTSIANHRMQWLKDLVTLCIVDEAGQAIEPVTLIPLTLGVTRLALVGDPQQLPGFTRSQTAKDFGLGDSLFSRLCGATWAGESRGPAMLLDTQYRMHPHIADYPNRAFYDGKIQTAYTPRTDLDIPPYCVVFIRSESRGHAQTVNEKEARGVAQLVTALYNMLCSKKMSLAVITPYVAQREMIKKHLRTVMGVNESDPPVEVNTVDSFQGQERDVVVVSLVRRHGVGFLHDAGRMNVMLTRAKHSLLICVDPNALQGNQQWQSLINDAKKRGMYKHLPDDFVASDTLNLFR